MRKTTLRNDLFLLGFLLFPLLLIELPIILGENRCFLQAAQSVIASQAPSDSLAESELETLSDQDESKGLSALTSIGAQLELYEFISEGQGNIPMRWIPNQRVLCGAPATTITLKDTIDRFRDEGAFGPPESFDVALLKVSIVSKIKKNLVTPQLDTNRIVLDWTSRDEGKGEIIIGLKYPDNAPVFLSFQYEVWRPHFVWMIAVVIGGLGFFLFGMRNMSEGLQMIAGAGLQRLIAIFTENRFLAIGIGVLVTMVIQSSSVTTVMVVGFINSQIMTLSQGISVIIGANIGTTVTGWLLTLKIGDYGLPIIGISTFVYLFCTNNKIRYIAMSIMGLGFLFFGLKTMEAGFAQLVELREFGLWMKSFAATDYLGVLKCIAIGCVLTMVVQSSSATLGITISLASIGAIDFQTAAALVLGENIGTTITAILVSFGTQTNARRAAYFHAIFNCLGVTWASILFLPVIIPLVIKIAHVGHGQNITAGIALTHSLFNVTNALIFLPFTRVIAELLKRWVPETKFSRKPKLTLTSLGIRHMETPIIAIERSRIEVNRMANGCWEIAQWLQQVADEHYTNDKLIEAIFRQEATLDDMQDEVIGFLAEVLAKNHSAEIADSAREQMRVADELETVSDYFVAILKSNLKLKESNLELGEDVAAEFRQFYISLLEQFQLISDVLVKNGNVKNALREIYSHRNTFTTQVKDMRERFMQSISEKEIAPQVIVAVSSQLNYYRRLREHFQNIMEAMK